MKSRKNKVVHLGTSKLISLIRENLIVVIFTLIFIFGVLFGCIAYSSGYLLKYASSLSDFFIFSKIDSSFLKIFFTSFLLSFSFLFLTYLFGTSLIGLAFIPIVILTRGFISGLYLCDLYSRGAINALVINLLTVVPGMIIAVLILICAASKCMYLSYSLGKLSVGESLSVYKVDIKRFLLGFTLYATGTVFSALFEAFMSVAFRKYF